MNVGETPTQGRICAILQGSDAIGEQPPMLTDIFAVRRNPRACLRHFGVSKLKRGNLENQDIVFICPARCLHCSAQGVALPPGYSAVRYAIRKEPKCNGDATLPMGRRIFES